MKYVVIERDVRDDELDAIFGIWVFDREDDAIEHAAAIERETQESLEARQAWQHKSRETHERLWADMVEPHAYGPSMNEARERFWAAMTAKFGPQPTFSSRGTAEVFTCGVGAKRVWPK